MCLGALVPNPENAFDNTPNTQWITGTGGRRSWIKVELPKTRQIWKVSFHPRTGHQRTTQLFTHYWLEGSSDDVTYERILESRDQTDQDRIFEIESVAPFRSVTKPYKFFKI